MSKRTALLVIMLLLLYSTDASERGQQQLLILTFDQYNSMLWFYENYNIQLKNNEYLQKQLNLSNQINEAISIDNRTLITNNASLKVELDFYKIGFIIAVSGIILETIYLLSKE